MARQKTNLRLTLESYLKETDKDLMSDWLDLHYDSDRELRKIKSMLHLVKHTVPEAKSMIHNVDKANKIVWVLR